MSETAGECVGSGLWVRGRGFRTNSCHGVVLALGEDHDSLPLLVDFGQALGLPRHLCNVVRLRTHKDTSMR